MRAATKFVCQQCGYESIQWLGKCPSCGQWNSLVETIIAETKQSAFKSTKGRPKTKPQKLSDLGEKQILRISTQSEEFDRVLGGTSGGLVPGSVILLAGDPGIGKSTLLLQLAGKLGGFYISGEESLDQIKLRAKRIGVENKNLLFLAETNVENILEELGEISQKDLNLVIIDSVQTMWTADLSGMSGSVGQVRESATKLLQAAKRKNFPLFLVGHVTKEGMIAGPMVLKHLVDTVLYLEGERFQSLRLLRVIKNRFGPTDEVGVFQMEEEGLKEIKNPSGLFLSEERKNLSGSSLVMVMEGTRPLVGEVQALVVPTKLPAPRRTATGIDLSRLQLLIAVLQKRLNLPLYTCDIFVNVAGGLKIMEPAVDLGVCLAIISSFKDKPLPQDLVAIGEVGLLGELRPVANLDKRIKEAKRLGLTKIASAKDHPLLKDVAKKFLS
ncbi:DNA repair protein RadA [Candidatus Microgenomates bacterium]|nr:DNA repair protein RadA [Candidatus Microgenomates bacterium]